jgi:hypothetical protein
MTTRIYDPLRAAELDAKQTAYAEQRRAYTEEWMKAERVRLELAEKARPTTITNARKPKGLTL